MCCNKNDNLSATYHYQVQLEAKDVSLKKKVMEML